MAIVALILFASLPVAFCQQSYNGNATEMQKQMSELNATLERLVKDMNAFDKANSTINYSREQLDGEWFNVTSYTNKEL